MRWRISAFSQFEADLMRFIIWIQKAMYFWGIYTHSFSNNIAIITSIPCPSAVFYLFFFSHPDFVLYSTVAMKPSFLHLSFLFLFLNSSSPYGPDTIYSVWSSQGLPIYNSKIKQSLKGILTSIWIKSLGSIKKKKKATLQKFKSPT